MQQGRRRRSESVTTGEMNEGDLIEARIDAVQETADRAVSTVTADAGYAYARVYGGLERRFREVRRRTRPMGTFQDRTSMDRILFAVFSHQDKCQGTATPVPLTHKS